ncbi:phosphoglycerate mutase family protein [Vibrio sp. SCSIO 43136]|uniref:histidine phosphatase family protein n=1 Tax=Vibrio sp. SCSIO 43136 TaxID=2819101 RepID=UPI0020760F4C|nr:phosphoglycerate mutase family protein [Vibrio sp. SCSIO 43136]USD66877.1 phosphoglycerate mutase family protein [Vibrio sp. SCSIO 43136]
MPTSKLILIRHAKTAWNQSNRLHGQLDCPILSSEYIVLDHLATDLLSRYGRPDLVITSDLGRAVSSANRMASLCDAVSLTNPLLRERFLGQLQGVELVTAKRLRYANRFEKPLQGEFGEEVESDYAQRIYTFLKQLCSDKQSQTVWVVTHGEWIRAAMNILSGRPSWHQGIGVIDNSTYVEIDVCSETFS